jgi:N-acetylglutamate synthase-like GNAT family acetyltransferase
MIDLDLASRVNTPAVQALLATCVGCPTRERMRALSERYRSDPTWHLLGMAVEQEVVACLGLEIAAPNQGVIRCIAVAPVFRRQQVGRRLLNTGVQRFSLQMIEAETDAEAVGFYRHCGFLVTSLGELYPGVERFRCVLQPQRASMS